PHLGRPDTFADSSSCKACHADQYSSWHASYHRTMTQLASPEAVRGNFDNVSLELDGAIYRLEKKGDEFWVEMPDPEWRLRQPKNGPVDSNAPRVRRRITMTTGSHH